MDEQTKKCKVCKEVKPLSKFPYITRSDGKQFKYNTCRSCRIILDSKKPSEKKINEFVSRSMWGLGPKDY